MALSQFLMNISFGNNYFMTFIIFIYDLSLTILIHFNYFLSLLLSFFLFLKRKAGQKLRRCYSCDVLSPGMTDLGLSTIFDSLSPHYI